MNGLEEERKTHRKKANKDCRDVVREGGGEENVNGIETWRKFL